MKMLKYTVSLIAVLLFIACNNDDLIDLIDVDGPTNISADFSIKQDNSGRVTITPNADSASLFDIYFGDGTGEYATVQIGESVERIYSEGTYNVRIVAKSINGKTAEGESQLVVSFRPPENLVVNIDYDPENNFKISVSATADYAALFNVYFGDVADEIAGVNRYKK